MSSSDEVRKVEGVVLGDHNQVLWDPEQKTQKESPWGIPGTAFERVAAKPFLLKAGLAFLMLPLLALFAMLALVFVMLAFFLGRPVRIYRGGWKSWKVRPQSPRS